MIPWLEPYAGVWALTEPYARLMSIKLNGLVTVTLSVEDFAKLQAQTRSEVPENAYPAFVDVIKGVAIVRIRHVLSKEKLLSGQPSLVEIAATIRQLTADPAVHSLLLKIDSPGGSIAGLDSTAAAIREARLQKRVITFIDDCACSAAYWLASQAEEVIANPTAAVGSIGAYAVLIDSSEATARAGYRVLVASSGEMKALGEPGTPITDEQLGEVQHQIDRYGELFVQAVADGRGLALDTVRALHTGRVWIGREAVEVGLVDRIARFEDVFQHASNLPQEDLTLSSPTPKPDEPIDEPGLIQRVTQAVVRALRPSEDANLPDAEALAALQQQTAQALEGAQARLRDLEDQRAELDVDSTLTRLTDRVTPAAQKAGLRDVLLKLRASDADAYASLVDSLEQLPDLQLFAGDMASEAATGEPRRPSNMSATERAYLADRGITDERDQDLARKYRQAYKALG